MPFSLKGGSAAATPATSRRQVTGSGADRLRRSWGLAGVILRRVLSVLLMIFLVASFTFFLVRMLPGDPMQQAYELLITQGVAPEVAQRQVEAMYGFVSDQPLHVQYLNYISNLAHLNLGRSISFAGVEVSHLVASAAPYTVGLVFTGIIASFVFGVLLGVIAAVRRGTRTGDFITITASMLHGVPQFVMALLLLYIFYTMLHWLPYGAPYDAWITPGFTPEFIGSLAQHAVLPVATYALSSYGGWLLATKASVVTVLGDDFIMAAELRGLKQSTILGYIARNAMLPLFTILTLSIGFMFGGSLFIEKTFNYQGLGTVLLNSINQRDYPLMSGSFLLISSAVIIANAVADILYAVIDPRVRRSA